MKFRGKIFFNKNKLSSQNGKKILTAFVLGLIMTLLFSGKSRMDLESIAVSHDEQYVACFETGKGYKIHCFDSNGLMSFTYSIPVDISAGGHCTLWFEDDVVRALFYRTDKVVSFALDGSILDISNSTFKEYPPEYPMFIQKECQYFYDGEEIDVIYNRSNNLKYWFGNAERYLVIIHENGEIEKILFWTAKAL